MGQDFENLASYTYDPEIDKKVRNELEFANIPIVKLPAYMQTEVKTCQIGMLNGFVFYRAWRYWVCEGDMPLEFANQIYEKYKNLNIRAGGHCLNRPPSEESYNPIYRKELEDYWRKGGSEVFLKSGEVVIKDDPTQPRYVAFYHIDTMLGLCKLAKMIREKEIHCQK